MPLFSVPFLVQDAFLALFHIFCNQVEKGVLKRFSNKIKLSHVAPNFRKLYIKINTYKSKRKLKEPNYSVCHTENQIIASQFFKVDGGKYM